MNMAKIFIIVTESSLLRLLFYLNLNFYCNLCLTKLAMNKLALNQYLGKKHLLVDLNKNTYHSLLSLLL